MNTLALTQTSGTTLSGFVQETGPAAPKSETEAPQISTDAFQKGESEPEKKINWKALGKLALGTIAYGALGVFAGLATGPIAAAAGAVAGLAGGIATGLLAGAYLGDKFGHGDSPKVAGIALCSTLLGLAAGAGAGIYIGAAISHPVAAVALGLLGAVGGFGRGVLKMASQKP